MEKQRVLTWVMVTSSVIIPSLTGVQARDTANRYAIGFFGSAVKMVLGQVDHSTIDQWAGLQFKYGLNPYLTINVATGYGWVYPRDPNGSQFRATGGYKTLLIPFNLNTIISLSSKRVVNPFISFGAGVTEWNVRDVHNVSSIFDTGTEVRGKLSGTLIAGLGLEAFWKSNFSTQIGFRYHHLLKGNEDTIGTGDDNRGIVELGVGLCFYFGGFKDRDGDLIEDKKDLDPVNPEDFDGFQDEDGIPDLDNDNDGILDKWDKAPNQPEDLDGFEDEDGVPDPDNDQDGIPDVKDECPNQPEDYDGYADEDGCPDYDNDEDSIPDSLDTCPNWPETFNGYQDDDGCPDEKPTPKPEPIKKAERVILKGVQFAPSSAVLTEESYQILDEVYESLAQNPEIEVEIRGYTDNLGSANSNLVLSQRRAEAVKQYLVNRGLAAYRLRAIGYGESNPIATNLTNEGRAANRRIEFVRIK